MTATYVPANIVARALPKATAVDEDVGRTPVQVRSLAALSDDPEMSRPPDWIVDQFFERGSLNSVYGIGKGGKSTMLAHIAIHTALGVAFAGYHVAPGRVLWIDLEQGPRRLTRNLKKVARWSEAAEQLQIASDLSRLLSAGHIRELIEEHRPTLVVIDSLSKFCQVEDDNDNGAWTKALRPLEAVARASNAAVVVIDHDRKGEGLNGRAMRGASSKLAAFDTAIHVTRGSGENVRKLDVVSREVGDFAVEIELVEGAYRRRSAEQKNVVLALLIEAGMPQSSKIIHQRMKDKGIGGTERTVRNHLDDLVAKGLVHKSDATGSKSDPAVYTVITSGK